MIAKLCLLLVLLPAPAIAAADQRPQPGSYGFNWLDAESQCKELTAKDLAAAPTCTVNNDAFGLRLQSHVCKVNAKIELMVYQTAAQCREALETMQANGP